MRQRNFVAVLAVMLFSISMSGCQQFRALSKHQGFNDPPASAPKGFATWTQTLQGSNPFPVTARDYEGTALGATVLAYGICTTTENPCVVQLQWEFFFDPKTALIGRYIIIREAKRVEGFAIATETGETFFRREKSGWKELTNGDPELDQQRDFFNGLFAYAKAVRDAKQRQHQ